MIAVERSSQMARIRAVSQDQAGLYLKLACHFTRRTIAKVTGRESERMIEPLQVYAHVPELFTGTRTCRWSTKRRCG